MEWLISFSRHDCKASEVKLLLCSTLPTPRVSLPLTLRSHLSKLLVQAGPLGGALLLKELLSSVLLILRERITPVSQRPGSVGSKLVDLVVVASEAPLGDVAVLHLVASAAHGPKRHRGIHIGMHHNVNVILVLLQSLEVARRDALGLHAAIDIAIFVDGLHAVHLWLQASKFQNRLVAGFVFCQTQRSSIGNRTSSVSQIKDLLWRSSVDLLKIIEVVLRLQQISGAVGVSKG